MTSYKYPSILFVSASLAVYYASHLIRRDGEMKPALHLLLQTLIRSPVYTEVRKVGFVEGHCYRITLDRDYHDDQFGSSVLMVLENGRPLPHPHASQIGHIKQAGGGRYVHIGRHIFFSPSDNADLGRNPRLYSVVETLTRDIPKIKALAALGNGTGFSNPGALLLTKIQIYLAERFRVGSFEAMTDSGVDIADLMLDLGEYGFGKIHAGHVAIRWTSPDPWGRLDMVIRDLRADWLPVPVALSVSLGFTRECALRLDRFDLDAPGHTRAVATFDWSATGLETAAVSVTGLDAIRNTLLEGCGSTDAWAGWLKDFVAAIGSGDLPLVDHLPEDAQATLVAALSPGSGASQLDLNVLCGEDGATARCEAI